MSLHSIASDPELKSRLHETLAVMNKYALIDWLKEYKDSTVLDIFSSLSGEKSIREIPLEERIRRAFSELGTSYVKLGQMLSTRSDLIGNEMAETLSSLQSVNETDSWDYIHDRVIRELELSSLGEVFEEFSEEAMASASIAQVHSAQLLTGEKVVVKVIHEGAENKIANDIKLMSQISKLAHSHLKEFRDLGLNEIIEGFTNSLQREIDFVIEKNNLNIFTANFASNPQIVFPAVYDQACSKGVLTMEFLDGPSFKSLDVDEAEAKTLADLGVDMYMKMIFEDNFFHADPHPGNLVYLGEGSIGVLDCGMTGRLDSQSKRAIEDLVLGIVEKDVDMVFHAMLSMSKVSENTNMEVLKTDVEEFLLEYGDLGLELVDMSEIVGKSMDLIYKHHLHIPSSVAILLKALVLLEGTSQVLNPQFELVKVLADYYGKLVMNRFSPKSIFIKLRRNAHLWERIIDQMPQVIGGFMNKASQRNFTVNLDHQNLERSVNRVVIGVVLASMILASALLLAFRLPPLIMDISVIGIVILAISLYYGYKLIKELRSE
jgi:ubiquinone biosynthesis protein